MDGLNIYVCIWVYRARKSFLIALYVDCSKRVLSFVWFTISACSVTGKKEKKNKKNAILIRNWYSWKKYRQKEDVFQMKCE